MIKPKVTIVVGGRWHAIDLARELHQAGWLHRLITNYPKFKTRQWGVPDDKVVSLPLTLLLNRLIPKLAGEAWQRKFQPHSFQLFGKAAVHYLEGSTLIHGWSAVAEPSLIWAKQRGIPFVVEHSSAHIGEQAQILQQEYDKLGLPCTEVYPETIAQELREYQLADRIAVPSFFAKRTFLNQNFAENKLIHNPLGTDLTTFFPGEKQDRVFRVVYAGSLGVRKGIHYLVKAFRQADIPDSELILLGKTMPETSHLLSEADERVKCPGHVSEAQLGEYYRNSSVFVLPSLEDGFGMVLAQALASGIPIIGTTNTGCEDLLRMQDAEPISQFEEIEEYSSGYIVPPKNSEAIALLLKLLATDSELLECKRNAVRQFQPQALSWSAYGKRSIAGYQQLLSQFHQEITA